MAPTMLLLDEPTAALDADARAEVLSCLRQLAADYDVPLLLITHQLSDIAELCDHTVYLLMTSSTVPQPTYSPIRIYHSQPGRMPAPF